MAPLKGVATTLLLDEVFEQTAGQTYAYQLLGEATGIMPTVDESITIDVPIATMNTLLTYSSSWHDAPGSTGLTGSQPAPAVALRLKTVVGDLLAQLTAGLTGATLGEKYAANPAKLVVDGDNGSSCATLVDHFQKIGGFTYHDASGASDYLSAIPVEAIESFSTTDVDTVPISSVVGDLVAIPSPGATGAEEGLPGKIQALFEQAVAAGMVTAGETATDDLKSATIAHILYATLGDVEAATVAGTNLPVYGVQWSASQTLAFYVRFGLIKKRQYFLSDKVTPSSSAATSVSFGGIEFDLAGDLEESTPVNVTYQVVLRAV